MINRGFETMLPKKQKEVVSKTFFANEVVFTIFRRRVRISFNISSEEV